MLQQIKTVFDNPDDVPEISQASADYLMARCNYSYLQRSGVLDDLRKAGYSENHILGFVDGLAAASELAEMMANRKEDIDDVL